MAQCSKCTAIALTIFVFSVIFLSSLAIAFIRPFDFNQACPVYENDFVEVHEPEEYEYETEDDLIATNGMIICILNKSNICLSVCPDVRHAFGNSHLCSNRIETLFYMNHFVNLLAKTRLCQCQA